jgi:DNA (cytosine-5)-methyltransferase 1
MKFLIVKEFFSGIGSQTQALKNLGVLHKTKISEIDKHAIKSYEAIHGKTENLGNICDIKSIDYTDLLTYSFPCQDLSVAGKQEGIKKGNRSGLLYEVERVLEKITT